MNREDLRDYGCEDNKKYSRPIYTWTPSIAASQGIQYNGNYFDIFKNNVLIGSLGGLSLFRIIIEDNEVINIEKKLKLMRELGIYQKVQMEKLFFIQMVEA